MKTAITKIMYVIEMEHNNGVEISQRVLWKMLNEAKKEEKQQIIEAYNDGCEYGFNNFGQDGEEYYKNTFKNDEINF